MRSAISGGNVNSKTSSGNGIDAGTTCVGAIFPTISYTKNTEKNNK